jgi:diguanylate cyclase (GGDEF)-like protein
MAASNTETTEMEQERGHSLRPIWALIAVMAVAAGALLAPVSHLGAVPHVDRIPWPLLALGIALGEACALELRFRGESQTFSVSDIVLVVALFSTSPTRLVVAELIASAIVLAARRTPVMKFCFNLVTWVLAAQVTVVVFHWLGGQDPLAVRSWLAVFAALGTGIILQTLATATVITFAEGQHATVQHLRGIIWPLLATMVDAMLGLVVVIVCAESLGAAALLIGPTLVVFVAYRAYLSEHTKSEGLRFLYEASELLSSARDLEGGVVALLDFARDTFHADLAEIVIRGEEDETIGYHSCAGPADRLKRLEPTGLDAVEAVLGIATDDAIVYRPDEGTPLATREGVAVGVMMVAAMQDDEGVRGGVTVARKRGSALGTFSKDELKLFDTFVNHLGTTLEKRSLSTSLAQLRALKQELAHQAYHDSLTGLANRLKFRDLVDNALKRAAEEAGKVAVLFIDLDDFKTVNDTMGHAAGDALLEEVARRIADSVGDFGSAARLGGDEFAVLLPEVSNDSEVRAVADRILVALGDPVNVEGQSVIAQASIGIATHVGAADAAELMQHADVAMYTAKRNGKGRFDEFEPNMSLTVARRHQLKVGLERAIADNEFVMHYQPVIDVATGTITATEALLRWKDPSRGMMPPAEFVGVAEETGLIVPIGRQVLLDACQQAAEWMATTPELRVFVNLSTRQLADADIVDDVRRALAESGLPASQLVLEVTETAMMRDIDEAKATLHALKQLGVGIAIDDFGTGFSSLSYLRQLPIDVLKIAKPIVDAICDSPQDAAFVKGIIELGHVVGLKVIAEGVERVEQYAHLVDMGCDFVQGYYYAPSMEPAEMAEVLATPIAERPAAIAHAS